MTTRLCMLSGSFEYDSEESLAIFEEHLRAVGRVECSTVVFESEDDDRSLAPIDDADVLLVFTRRLNTAGRELERFRSYCAAGRPIVGVRTASHGFQNWLGFDGEVLGGSYDMHYGAGPLVRVDEAPGASAHPILEGVAGLVSHGSLYRNTPIADDAALLLTGTTDEATEPVAWTRMNAGGRVFYTSLGHQDDFRDGRFLRLLTNGVLWAAGIL